MENKIELGEVELTLYIPSITLDKKTGQTGGPIGGQTGGPIGAQRPLRSWRLLVNLAIRLRRRLLSGAVFFGGHVVFFGKFSVEIRFICDADFINHLLNGQIGGD